MPQPRPSKWWAIALLFLGAPCQPDGWRQWGASSAYLSAVKDGSSVRMCVFGRWAELPSLTAAGVSQGSPQCAPHLWSEWSHPDLVASARVHSNIGVSAVSAGHWPLWTEADVGTCVAGVWRPSR